MINDKESLQAARCSVAQACRATYEQTTPLIKPQQSVSRPRDTDSGAFSNHERGPASRVPVPGTGLWPCQSPKPQWSRCAQIHAVQCTVDPQRRSEPPRAARKVHHADGSAVPPHVLDTHQRFQRPDQHPAAHPGNFSAHVKREMITIAEVNIGMAAPKKHRAIPGRRTTEMVRGGISLRIRLSLYDTSGDSAGRQFAHHDFAD